MAKVDESDELGAVSLKIPGRIVVALVTSMATVLGAGYVVGTKTGTTVSRETVLECSTAMETATEAMELSKVAVSQGATALDVRGQHGAELGAMQETIADLGLKITRAFETIRRFETESIQRDQDEHIFTIERTASRHTAEDEREHENAHARRYALIQERLAQHERGMKHMEEDLERLEKLVRGGRSWIEAPD